MRESVRAESGKCEPVCSKHVRSVSCMARHDSGNGNRRTASLKSPQAGLGCCAAGLAACLMLYVLASGLQHDKQQVLYTTQRTVYHSRERVHVAVHRYQVLYTTCWLRGSHWIQYLSLTGSTPLSLKVWI
jgi:hypothetical protein